MEGVKRGLDVESRFTEGQIRPLPSLSSRLLPDPTSNPAKPRPGSANPRAGELQVAARTPHPPDTRPTGGRATTSRRRDRVARIAVASICGGAGRAAAGAPGSRV